MKTSEKILLGVLGVVCLYAGYILFLEDKPEAETEAVQTQTEVDPGYTAMVSTVEEQLGAKELTSAELYCVELALGMTGRAPFYASSGQFYFSTGAVAGTGGLEYSGYLQIKGKSFAIINGVEYEAGEELAMENYRLVRVTKDFVIVERKDPNSGKVFKKQVPLAGGDLEQISLRTAP